ncbi:hypothetical protein ABH922_005182 [Rhodococcus sp. 27YEA15]
MDDQNYNYMVTFAKKWRHWSGGSGEEILIEFGLSQSEFFRRLHKVLGERTGSAADLPEPLREELKTICQQRLRAGTVPLPRRA